ncbi:MAG: SDR family NAD(P)-dependent oxidoreductase [Sandaracinaceae bacterium]|nr:SDR family NAD(P)-dependent oxidoreductase [Sandaracinaceae bacterium]MBK7153294.1 SDR family NAD(P)-dependent oxidoreductase [Sandaracinaceae bacterium]
MDYRTSLGSHALVIGASTTIGEQFARQLAKKGMNVVLVARRQEELERVAADIRREHAVEARVVALDLMEDGAVDRLVAAVSDVEISLLVVNANLHKVNLFDKMDLDTKLRMIRMNTELPVRLVHTLGPPMLERGRGGIILISSLNCLTPLEIDSVFQGTKAFILLFGESLWAEYRRRGVKVAVTLVNGIEGSESYEKKLSPRSRKVAKLIGGSMPPERIVASSLTQFERDYPVLVPDFLVPINRSAVQLGLLVRMAKSRALTLGASGLFGMLLDGDEVQSGMR